jgi:predicted secreted protein with PEFG-CTERM motif
LQSRLLAYVLVLSALIILPASAAYAEHIFENNEAFAQHLDISQISAEKFVMAVDDDFHDMYYGYSGSIDSMGSDKPHPILSHMSINQERKSLEITFSEVRENSVFWVRMPNDVISAEKGKFKVFVDGKDTLYDLTIRSDNVALGMVVPKDGQHVEIIGTTVIPEFDVFAILILGASILGMIYFVRKSSFGMSLPELTDK